MCAALGLALSGCPSAEQSDQNAASPSDEPEPTRGVDAPAAGTLQLELMTRWSLQLRLNETALLSVRLKDADGQPVEEGRVGFALVGSSQDSTVTDVEVTTDEQGVAETALIAGSKAAVFHVRISAPGAHELYVDVGVSDAGFGTLLVRTEYMGARTALQRIVYAQAESECERAERSPGHPMATLGQRVDVARFPALPAGVSYALLAFAEGKDGTVVARGCTDGIAVRADRQVTARIVFTDEPLEVSGAFALQTVLDAAQPAATLGTAIRLAAETLVRTDAQGARAPNDAEGRFLLDSLDSTLRSETYGSSAALALADALAQERAMAAEGAGPEQTLDDKLAIHETGALRVAVPRIVALTRAATTTLQLAAVLEVAADAGGGADVLPAQWRPQRVEAIAQDPDVSPVVLDLSGQDPVEAQLAVIDGRDAVALAPVRFQLPFGSLAAQALHRVVSFDAVGHGTEIREAVGCTTLEDWLSDQAYADDSACDAGCVQAACDRAVTRLVSAAETALAALDADYPMTTLSGELALGDYDGDLMAERMTSDMFSGQWLDEANPSSPGDEVAGPASGVALAPATP